MQGAAQVREKIPDAVSIFVLPPGPEVLAMRLRSRSRAEGGEPAEMERVIERRLAQARHEIENYREYGYILVNDNLEHAVQELEAIVQAERTRRGTNENDPEKEQMLRLADQCRQENSTERLKPVLTAFGLFDSEEALK